mmetsp:Transcript_18626/g.58060  ORF Transcript_18626/g.58060 Transcript_18626/m.58060 type:complete len:213 (-) Transcript_18626:1133-1771(-)
MSPASACRRGAPCRRRSRELARPAQLIVAAAALRRRLGPARLFGHDDLVDAQHGDCGVGRQLERLLLGRVEVEYALLHHVARSARVNVDAGRALALVLPGVEVGDHVGRVEARVVRERARHDLHRLRKLVDRVLVEARLLRAKLVQCIRDRHLARAAARHEARVRAHGLDDRDAVLNRALQVVEDVARRAAHDDCRHLGANRVATVEYGALG